MPPPRDEVRGAAREAAEHQAHRRHRQPGLQRRVAQALRLRAAATAFHGLGAAPWFDRAVAELTAIGAAPRGTAPAGAIDELAALTAQERQVVLLAATGAGNREIAAQLFLSHRTVGYHLYNAFPKLGITSRTELARLRRPGDRPARG